MSNLSSLYNGRDYNARPRTARAPAAHISRADHALLWLLVGVLIGAAIWMLTAPKPKAPAISAPKPTETDADAAERAERKRDLDRVREDSARNHPTPHGIAPAKYEEQVQ